MASEPLVSARKRKKKDRKVGASESPTLKGVLYRGSHVVPDCVKLREAILFEDKIGTFGRNYSNGKTEKNKTRVLDKVWVFAEYHKLDSIKHRKFSTLENERKHSVLNYLTSDHYVERELYAFNLKSEVASKRDGSAVVLEKLCLAFDEMEEAVKWRQAIAQQIGGLRRRQHPAMELGASCRDLGAHFDAEEGSLAGNRAMAAVRQDGAEKAQPPVQPEEADSTVTTGTGSEVPTTPEMRTPPDTPYSRSVFEDEEPFVYERATSLETLQAEIRTDARLPKMDGWKAISCEHGITVLRGTEQHNASSIMLSYVIRAPPRLCMKSLLKQSQQSEVGGFYLDIEVVETVDPFNDVLLTIWQPSGLQRYFMAPRRLRMRRLWRREDDGSYVALYKALDDTDQSAEHHWLLDWFAPVPCKLVNTCLTFSPLHSEYSRDGDSNETLVTQVSCYGDLGGWMSQSHPWRKLLNLVAPFSTANSWTAFTRPHVQCSIAMRNQAESARFCVRPFLQSHNGGSSEDLPPLVHKQPPEKLHIEELTPRRYEALNDSIQPPASYFAEASQIPLKEESPSELGEAFADHKVDVLASPPEAEDHRSQEEEDVDPTSLATCDPKYWACPGANGLKVRGKNYLQDRKKIPAQEPVFHLAATDLLQVERPTFHIARFLPSLKHSKAPFTFIMQIMFGSPSLSLTFSWAAPMSHAASLPLSELVSNPEPAANGEVEVDESEFLDKPFELTLARFLAGSTTDAEANKRRDGTLKLIPRISQGAWFVKQAVGTTPCLLGRKLTATYHRGPGYFEVDVDVSSSSVAANIVGLVQGMTKTLCVDMAICLEGHSHEELPEALLGTVRCSHLDLGSAKLLNTDTGEISEKSGGTVTHLKPVKTAPVGNIAKGVMGKRRASLDNFATPQSA